MLAAAEKENLEELWDKDCNEISEDEIANSSELEGGREKIDGEEL